MSAPWGFCLLEPSNRNQEEEVGKGPNFHAEDVEMSSFSDLS